MHQLRTSLKGENLTGFAFLCDVVARRQQS